MRLRGGSSPLTRGKRGGWGHPRRRGGLIPAHAGKTRRMGTPASARWAHPRSRGENMASREAFPGVRGSSPLTRGKQLRGGRRKGLDGLIPAHAGKTIVRRWIRRLVRAHPRSRGENQDENIINLSKQGSSPLTRGKLAGDRERRRARGLIPAHAGKTTGAAHRTASNRAHPRSRGENAST